MSTEIAITDEELALSIYNILTDWYQLRMSDVLQLCDTETKKSVNWKQEGF